MIIEGKKGENAMTEAALLPPVSAEKRWFSYADLAARFDVSTRTIRRDVDARKLPEPDRFRGCLRFDLLKVDAARQAQKEN
ncbi:MAG TPA: HTH domain-containing protein [Candidatus Saccharimonadales bacterium]|nr:HTH domain-containing protein [Candidatus Saccharimonadales bacterium]